MELVELCEMELRYTALATLDYGADGQIFGTMEGTVSGERLRGTIQLTNLAPMRSDRVNCPTLRGLLKTADGASVYVTLDGIASLRAEDQDRVFTTSMTFRTNDERHRWLNTTFAVVEGVLDTVGVGGVARARVQECRTTYR